VLASSPSTNVPQGLANFALYDELKPATSLITHGGIVAVELSKQDFLSIKKMLVL
jgi:hypothetical protein